jgi:thiol-disulfide isomerase/thioredoxin
MRPLKFLALSVLAVALTAPVMRAAKAEKPATPKVGDTFPNLAKERLEGTVPDLKDKVVLVDFWASWCGPCKASFPALKEIHAKYAAQGFAIVAVSIDESKDDMNGFLKKNAVPFIILRDAKGTLAEKLDIQTVPSSFLIDRSGKVTMVHSGYGGEETKKEYIAAIEAALKK